MLSISHRRVLNTHLNMDVESTEALHNTEGENPTATKGLTLMQPIRTSKSHDSFVTRSAQNQDVDFKARSINARSQGPTAIKRSGSQNSQTNLAASQGFSLIP